MDGRLRAGSRRVLVAQPSPTLQMLIRLTLSADDLLVECVGDGRAAVRAAREEVPALLIVDSALPGIDGMGVAEVLHADGGGRGAPVLLLVPDYERPDPARLAEIGIVDVLARPFEQHELLARVRAIIGRPPARDDDAAALPARAPAPAAAATLQAPQPSAAPAAATAPDAAELDALIARAVDARLEALVGPALSEALDEALSRVVPHAVARMQNELGRRTEAALQAAADEVVRGLLEKRARELLVPLIEPIAWKVVPELAEDLIREEIRRLTEVEDP
ncbi:MAG: response regulator [Deltaproteobacteria bacterium]|nr:response regulator [Deltaproteobacteria bacterium]